MAMGVVHTTLSIYYYTRVGRGYSRRPPAPRVLRAWRSLGGRGGKDPAETLQQPYSGPYSDPTDPTKTLQRPYSDPTDPTKILQRPYSDPTDPTKTLQRPYSDPTGPTKTLQRPYNQDPGKILNSCLCPRSESDASLAMPW